MRIYPLFETLEVSTPQVSCDGNGGPLGHPRVYLHIQHDSGSVTCPYCSRTFVLAHHHEAEHA